MTLWRQLCGQRSAALSLGILLALVLTALGADFLASDLPLLLRFDGALYLLPNVNHPPALRAYDNARLRAELRPERGDWAWMPLYEYGPEQQPPILAPPPAAPSAQHWLGTDDRGRDVFARLVHGTRISLAVGFGSVALSTLIGLALGLFAGYLGGFWDSLTSRLIELGLTFPTFFLILAIMALVERTSLWMLLLVLGLTRWPGLARLARAEVLRLKELDFVAAARLGGSSSLRIVWRHLLPHALGPVLVHATFGVASAILIEAGLSFLGFGTPPPTASWGELLGQAMEAPGSWWLTLCPGLLLFATISALNRLGESLREASDPRLQR